MEAHLENSIPPKTNGANGAMPRNTEPSGVNGRTEMEPLAIVGFASHLAGDATDNESLWRYIVEGRSASGPFPQDRFQGNQYFHPDPEHGGTCATKGGYFLKKDIDTFDASFFRLSEYDIAAMDPQQKLLLENVYHAIENAGLPMESLVGSRTSVYVGSSTNDHAALTGEDLDFTIKNKATGTLPSLLANRVSWFYDLKGASVVIDTACSSSLVALHMACLDIRAGGCDTAIVSGINILQHPGSLMLLSNLGVLSPDGQSYAFDDRANGYGRGEGVITVVIKPLQAAIRDGDQVRALIRASGVSSDGKTAGITLPSEEQQKALIKDVYASANLDMNETTYVEAHGTGTPVGDPLECKGIMSAFRTQRRKDPLYIGSIKAGIGHLEGGAGLAGLVKAIMMLEKQVIPPIANLQRLNPLIPQDGHNVCFSKEAISWPESQTRRASVNSFGFGGTNAHVVLESPDRFLQDSPLKLASKSHAAPLNGLLTNGNHPKIPSIKSEKQRIFVISSNDENGIQRNAMRIKDYIESALTSRDFSSEADFMKDLAYTLYEKRSRMKWRAAVIASSLSDLSQQLVGGTLPKFRAANNEPGIAFVFTGQGAQWLGMGKMLMEFPIFRRSVEAASLHLQKQGSQWSLHDAFDPIENELSDINHPIQAQTACTVLQVALIDLLRSWNIQPSVVIGHSSGEIGAAFCAGAITREAAWNVAYYRGLVSSILLKGGGGAMLAVGLHPKEAQDYINRLSPELQCMVQIGCYNSPKNVTVTGDRNTMLILQSLLDQDGVFNRLLATQVAYHSKYMQPVADIYAALLKLSDLSAMQMQRLEKDKDVLMISSVTGEPIGSDMLQDPQYWTRNLISPVRFMDAIQRLKKLVPEYNVQELIEIGPHSALQSAIRESLADGQSTTQIRYNHAITRKTMTYSTILHTAAGLHCRGYAVNLSSVCFDDDELHSRSFLTDLPGYAFNHEVGLRAESRRMKNSRLPAFPRHELLGSPDPDWDRTEPRWRNFLRTAELPWLRDNQVNGGIIFPGVGYSIMAMEAVKQITDNSRRLTGFRLRQISMEAALIVPDTRDGLEVMTRLHEVYDEGATGLPKYQFSIKTHDTTQNEWIEHCTGFIEPHCEVGLDGNMDTVNPVAWNAVHDLHALQNQCTQEGSTSAFYDALERSGFNLGPTLKNLVDIRTSPDSPLCVTKIASPTIADHMPMGWDFPYIIHPSTMESMAHAILHVCTTDDAPVGSALLARFIDDIWVSNNVSKDPGHLFLTVADGEQVSPGKWRCAITVWDDVTKEIVIQIRGTELRLLSAGRGDQKSIPECFLVKWYPSLDLVTKKSPIKSLDLSDSDVIDACNRKNDFERLCNLYITQALVNLRGHDRKLLPAHSQRFLDWMIKTAMKSDTRTMRTLDVDRASKFKEERGLLESLRTKAKELGSRGELLVKVGDNIVPYIKGDKDPQWIITGQENFKGWSLDQDLPANIKHALFHYVQTLRRSRGELKVLEIGAGTGSATGHIIEALASTDEEGGSRFGKYHYTDEDDSYFEQARKKFADCSQFMNYQVLDLNKDVAAQGFEKNTYDLVIAAHALSKTPDLQVSLENTHSLLKPGGKLVLIENVKPESLCTPFVSGLSPSWWIGTEPFRTSTPLVSEVKWSELLKDNGFEAPFPNFRDNEHEEAHEVSLLISAAIRPKGVTPVLQFNDIFIVHNNDESHELVSALVAALKQTATVPVVAIPFGRLRQFKVDRSFCVVIGELGEGYLDISTISENIYQELKWLLATCNHLLWISADDVDHPKAALSTGLIRTLRWERDADSINFLTLKFAQPCPPAPELISTIVLLFRYYTDGKVMASPNCEFSYRDGHFWENRLYPAKKANSFFKTKSSGAVESQSLGDNMDRPLKAHFKGSGRQGLLVWSEDEAQLQPLAASDIHVVIEASALNFQDGMAIRGEIGQQTFGLQAAGIVSEVGSGVNTLKPGDRVMVLLIGSGQHSLSRSVRINSNFAQLITSNTEYTQAATIPATFTATQYALRNVARLVRNEKILVHGAMYASGQAAIQLAKLAEADVFATVKTSEQKERLQALYQIPSTRIFLLTEQLDAAIHQGTNGSGVDVVLNFLHGSAAHSIWHCVGPMGRFVDMALKTAGRHRDLDMSPFMRNAMYVGVDLTALDSVHYPLIHKVFSEIGELYRSGSLVAPSKKLFSYSNFNSAMLHIQSDTTMDTAVVVPRSDDIVQVVPRQFPAYRFPTHATYVIAGGLGGLGRSAARWMCSRGVRHLILISRSGVRTAAAKDLLQDLATEGCEIKICQCDITEGERLQQALRKCASGMPPIKGCLQSTMLLQDSVFENMSYEQFMTGIRPKVQGTLNVFAALPSALDFFLVLSSAASIVGNRGQANYNSANAFQDSFAEHLTSKGIPGMSVNLGNMLSVGWVAENEGALPMELVYSSIDETEFHALLEYHLDPHWGASRSVETCHTIAGVRSGNRFHEERTPLPGFMNDPLFTLIRQSSSESADQNGQDQQVSISSLLRESESVQVAAHHVAEAIIYKLSGVMSFPVGEIDSSQGLASYGVDSLVTIDFRTWIAKEMGATVSTADILDGGSINDLSEKVARQSKFVEAA